MRGAAAALAVAAMMAALGLAGCGKKGNPVRPDGGAAALPERQSDIERDRTGEIVEPVESD